MGFRELVSRAGMWRVRSVMRFIDGAVVWRNQLQDEGLKNVKLGLRTER